MTRFNILAIIAGQNQPLTCVEIAKLSGRPGWHTRSFRASLATRLRKLRRWGCCAGDSVRGADLRILDSVRMSGRCQHEAGNDSRGRGRRERSIRWTTKEEFQHGHKQRNRGFATFDKS